MSDVPDDLRRVLAARLPDGSRAVVPILGSGLNLQAGGPGCLPETDWDGLLTRVGERLGYGHVRAPGGSLTARWEELLRLLAMEDHLPASRAEARLQREVVAALAELEAESASRPFYGRVLDAGFRDVVSLNFDRRLPLHARVRGLVVPAREKGDGDPSLHRHAVVRRRNGIVTRIWFPHGDTASRSTLKLGVHSYGRYIAALEWARKRHKKRQRLFTRATGAPDVAAWCLRVRDARGDADAPSWLDVLFTAPIVFVGCGLSADEWPLWWALHQRARNMARWAPEKRLDGWVLWAGDPPPHLDGGRADLRVALFPDFEALWGALLEPADSPVSTPPAPPPPPGAAPGSCGPP